MSLPTCACRKHIGESNRYFCEHPQVIAPDGLVSRMVCRLCKLSVTERPINARDQQLPHRRDELLNLQSIAVVIPCHNYGRFLNQAIDSVLQQKMAAREMLVIVDRSSDGSAAVAAQYEAAGVRNLAVDYGNVHAVRRRGFEETSSDVICFLDADDWIAPDYLQLGMQQFTSHRVGIVYSDLTCFGDSSEIKSFPEQFSMSAFRQQNCLHAGSLVRRDALEITRAFDAQLDSTVANCTGDWWLWKCVLEGGWTAQKQSGRYHYRRHGESALASTAKTLSYFRAACLDRETLTLFIPLSGRSRLWPQMATFLECQTWPHDQIRLIILDTSQSSAFSSTVREWIARSDYKDIRYVERAVDRPALADAERQVHARDVRLAMARIYNLLRAEASTEFIWTLEDDILPPVDVARRLLEGFDPLTGSVAAPYRSRFHSGYVAWTTRKRSFQEPEGIWSEVGGNGFGCTIFRSELLESTIFSHQHRQPDFDHAFYACLQDRKLRAKVNWEVECRHYDASGISFVGGELLSKNSTEVAAEGAP